VLVDTGGAEAVGRSELQNDAIGIEHHQETPRLDFYISKMLQAPAPAPVGCGWLWGANGVCTETLSLTGYLEH